MPSNEVNNKNEEYLHVSDFNSNLKELHPHKIKSIDAFADYLIIIYYDQPFFDIFKKNGKLKERRYIKGINKMEMR